MAQDAGADYVELARVFNTDGKRETRLLNLSLLKEICACVSIPVIASGGITEENMEMLAGIGVDGVASIHSVFFRRDTAAATALVRRSVDDVVLPQSGIQGAIFDMDGTLIDSMAIWEELGERYIRNKNMTPKPDLNEAVKHLSLSQASSYLKHEYNIDLPQEEIYHQLSRTVKIYYDSEAKLKEGALELLEKLKERKVPIALLTATDRGQTESILKRCGIYDFFDVILTVAEFGQSKAHTAIFKEVRHRLGTPVNTTWVFEDALYAAAAAKRAGFRVTAVYDESGRCDWDKIRRKADIAVESLADFPVERL